MEEAADADEREAWRKRLFYYLNWLFQRDATAGAEFAGLQARAPAAHILAVLQHDCLSAARSACLCGDSPNLPYCAG